MTFLCLRHAIAASLIVFFGPASVLASPQANHTKSAVAAPLDAAAKPQASSPAEAIITLLSSTHRFEQTAISPDGKKVAWVEDVITKRGVSTGDTVIFAADVDGKDHPRRISAGPNDAIHAEGSVAWSPDGKKIAFLSDAVKTGQLQLYVMDLAASAGTARKLTQVKGFLSTPG
ncbi:MAG: TolB family protein, partial [Candidatus Acidiferrum sp.]